jgi:uncharacterized protein YlxW (UPF0749 family)
MGLIELPLIIAGWILTAGIAGIGGSFVIQGKNTERVDKVRDSADQKIESLIQENKLQTSTLLRHVQNVEAMINNMRAELPEKYTLKSDHLRLEEKVDGLAIQFYAHRDKDSQ